MEKGLVAIRCGNDQNRLAQTLAKDIGIKILSSRRVPTSKFVLEIYGQELKLCFLENPRMKPWQLDFNRVRPGAGKDPLLRAIGGKARNVLDATAGWCGDALHIARHGIKVAAIEQHKLIFAMVEHAWAGINDLELKQRLSLKYGSSVKTINQLTYSPDVIYLDPMYPESTKSAATRKEIYLLRNIVGTAGDGREIFDAAMVKAAQRVVVKRPHYAESIAPGKVGETRSKLVRFDIYKPNTNSKL